MVCFRFGNDVLDWIFMLESTRFVVVSCWWRVSLLFLDFLLDDRRISEEKIRRLHSSSDQVMDESCQVENNVHFCLCCTCD